jgi:hypothetical protein
MRLATTDLHFAHSSCVGAEGREMSMADSTKFGIGPRAPAGGDRVERYKMASNTVTAPRDDPICRISPSAD